MKRAKVIFLVLAVAFLGACNNGAGTDNQLNNTDTNFSDSRRNSTMTENTITGDSTSSPDSTKAFDSAMHRGREGRH